MLLSRSLLPRQFLTALIILLTAAMASAEVPQVISYQGRLLDAGGSPVADGPQLMQFIIYDAPAGGTALWTSGFHSTNVEDGLFSVLLGASPHPPLPHDLFGGDFFSPDTARWLGITVGVDPEITPRTKFTAQAYAYQSLRADTAEVAWDIVGQTIGTDNLVDSSVTTEVLAPGVAARVGELHTQFGTTSTTSTTPVTMQSFFVDAPAAGKVLIIASGQFYLDIDATSTTSAINSCRLGLCDAPNTGGNTSCGDSFYFTFFQDADNASGLSQTKYFTITRYFDIAGSGLHSFYLNGATSDASHPLVLYGDIRYAAVWAPEELGVYPPLKADETGPVEPETVSDPAQR